MEKTKNYSDYQQESKKAIKNIIRTAEATHETAVNTNLALH